MKKQWIIACLIGIQGVNVQAQQPNKYPYQDTKLTVEQRADDLLQRLTLEEKVALMQNNSPAIPRLGIKPYEWWNEALHGVARAGLATVFPQAIGMAASFNDELLYEVFDAVSDEARAKNRQFNEKGQYKRYQGLTMWTPNVNIFRDPRWGRGQETYGEDPYLSGRMGMAAVRGLQGPEDAEYDKLHACAKHFAVHSGPEWNRHSFNAENIAPRDLWETYLPAFKELVQKAGVKEVMCAYNRFEGDPCCGSNRLLTQILRNDWGFKGIVVTDCGAIGDFFQRKKHETHPDAAHASADAVLSGTDLECGGNFKSITDAVKKGLISEEKINTSVKRLLKARFELGEMNSTHPWSNIPFSVIDCPKHKELALKMAHESLVLLQNNNNLLPLNRQMKVAVIGPNANDSVMQWGNYNGFPSHTVTLLEGIRAKLPDAQIIYEPVCGYTNDTTLHSLFNQCSIDGEAGFNATYWNNREYKGKIAATDRLTTPFHFSAEGSTVFAPVTLLEGIRAKLPDAQIIYEPVCGYTNDTTLHSLFNQCSIDGEAGFNATYWNNREYKGKIAATDRLTTPFHFSAEGSTVFAPGVGLKNFTAIYRSTFRPTDSGAATFRVMTNGGVTLFLNGKQIAEATNIKNHTNLYSFNYEAGKSYDIELRFIQVKDNPALNFDLAKQTPMDAREILNKLQSADVVIFAGGISPLLEGESMRVSDPGFKGGDRTEIELPAIQREVLALLKKNGKKTVFVNFSGSAMAIVPETQNCDAILQAWYPGQAGGTAVADVLFGDYNPAGRLPITFYKSMQQLPDYEDYSMKGRTYRFMTETPLYPFGYGLSYTRFSYGKATLNQSKLTKGEKAILTIPVSNVGQRDGEEVVQVYICRPDDKEGPQKTLRGFQRVSIAKGKTQNVQIELPYDSFEWFDAATNTIRPLNGTYKILYGNSSNEKDLQTCSIQIQ